MGRLSVAWCWELGGGLGHLSRIARLSAPLANEGIGLSYALKDCSRAASQIADTSRIFQAPLWQGQAKGLLPPQNYAALLAHQGWLDPNLMEGRILAWQNFFRVLNADLVALDHAPTALLAAKITGLPTIRIGNGFESPPSQDPYPMFNGSQVPPGEFRALQKTLSTSVKTFLPGKELHEALRADADVIAGIPELDHYASHAKGRSGFIYLGAQKPSAVLGADVQEPWSSSSRDKHRARIFIYLQPEQAIFKPMLQALDQLNCEVVAYAPGIVGEQKLRNGVLSGKPLALGTILPTCDLVICHSAVGTGTEALAFGVPVLLIPTQAEQAMAANRALATGAALAIASTSTAQQCVQAVDQALRSASLRDKAKAFANHPLLVNPQTETLVSIVTKLAEKN